MLSAENTRFNLGLTEPYFLNRDVAAGANIYKSDRRNEESRDYDEERTGGNLFINYPLSEHWRQTFSYRLDQSKVSDLPDNASRFLQAREGTISTSAISQRLTYDSRDSRILPTRGHNFWFNTEVAGVGFDSKHVSARTGISKLLPDPQWVTLNILAEGGAITGYGGKDVEQTEVYSLGGPRSFRGFEQFGVGPRTTTGDEVGGNLFYRGTAQLDFPLGLPKKYGVRGYAFTDVGSLWSSDDDGSDIIDENALRASAGVGLTWRSPFGPIGLYFAEPVLHEDYDETKSIEFNFGTRF